LGADRLSLASVPGQRYSTNTCSLQATVHPIRESRRHGSDQAPAGDLRLHPQVLGQVWLPAHGARHRQGGRVGVVVHGARAPGQPGEDRPAAPRSLQAASDRVARPGRREREGDRASRRASARRLGRRGQSDPR